MRTVLAQCAGAAVHQRQTYLAAPYAHRPPRLGKKRAMVAVAHSLLVSLYDMLRDGVRYQDLGSAHFDQQDDQAARRRAVRQFERQEFRATLTRSTA